MSIKKFKFVSDDIYSDGKTSVDDTFRNEIQSYWIKQGDLLKFHSHEDNEDQIFDISVGQKLSVRDFNVFETLEVKEEVITISAKEGKFATWTSFENAVKEIIDTESRGPDDDKFFEDHAAKFNIQIPDEDSNNQNIDVSFNYNFNAPAYEGITGDPNVPESNIETLYTYAYNSLQPSIDTRSLVQNEGKTLKRLSEKFPTGSKNILVDSSVGSELKNIYIPYSNVQTVKSFSSAADSFPMDIGVELPFKGKTGIINALGKTDTTELFMRQAIEGNNDTKKYRFQDQEIATQSSVITSKEIKEVNVLRWYEDQIENVPNEPLPFDYSFLGDETLGVAQATLGVNVGNYFSIIEFLADASNTLETEVRGFQDMLDGNLAYSETVMYRVAKFAADNINGVPLQNIYIPVAKEDIESVQNEVFMYIDTQVKYGKEYRYEVFAYRAIVGTAYNYTEISFLEPPGTGLSSGVGGAGNYDPFKAEVHVQTRPTLRVIEIPIFEKTGRIYRKPPVIPNVNVIPYRGIGNRMLFHFNSGAGTEEFIPVILSDKDQDYYDKIKEVLNLNDSSTIEYTSDTIPSAFEIYRTTKKPESYDDFKGKLRTVVSTVVNSKTFLTASSVAHVERMKPNQKYYYTFRALDSHGHPSNPTTIYEVEMVNDGSTIFPIIRSHDFSLMPTYKVKSKSFKRLIQVVPKISQSVVNKEASGLEDATTAIGSGQEIKLGLDAMPIWGKNFKIRLVSKKTGKKIDFNVSVGTSHIETEKERN